MSESTDYDGPLTQALSALPGVAGVEIDAWRKNRLYDWSLNEVALVFENGTRVCFRGWTDSNSGIDQVTVIIESAQGGCRE